MDVVQDLLDDVRLSDGRSGSRLCENYFFIFISGEGFNKKYF